MMEKCETYVRDSSGWHGGDCGRDATEIGGKKLCKRHASVIKRRQKKRAESDRVLLESVAARRAAEELAKEYNAPIYVEGRGSQLGKYSTKNVVVDKEWLISLLENSEHRD